MRMAWNSRRPGFGITTTMRANAKPGDLFGKAPASPTTRGRQAPMNQSGEALNPSLPPAWSGAGRDRGGLFMMNRGTMHLHLQREYVLFLAPLLILAAASWALLTWQAGMMNGMGLTMGMGIGLFLAVWVVMMVAMMFPATAPMNLAFAR